MKINYIWPFSLIVAIYACEYSAQPYKEGKKSYEFYCAPCHGMEAEGLGTLYPNLYLNQKIVSNRSQLACWILKGKKPDSIADKKTYETMQEMPGFRNLDPVEISNILNYLNARFWHLEAFSIQEISLNLTSCH